MMDLIARQIRRFQLTGISGKIGTVKSRTNRSMTDEQGVSKDGLSADWLLRGTLARLGDKFDRLTGRKAETPSSLATSQLVERLKRLLDSKAKDVKGKGRVVPHNIRLKVQWDKFSTGEDDSDTLKRLQNELLAAAADHINDSLYYTLGPLDLRVTPDYFTEGVKLVASFSEIGEDEDEGELNVTIPNMKIDRPDVSGAAPEPKITLRATIDPKGKTTQKILEVPADGRISMGRTGGNHLIIDDTSISKIHASLSVDANGEISVADTGSTNGTFINGQRVAYGKANKLVPSDVVTFGSVEVAFEIEREPAEIEESTPGILSNDKTVEIKGFEFTTKDPSLSEEAEPSPQQEAPSSNKESEVS
jgi:hypothetical protein